MQRRLPNRREWPDSEVAAHLIDVSYQGDSGKHVLKPYPGAEEMLIMAHLISQPRAISMTCMLAVLFQLARQLTH